MIGIYKISNPRNKIYIGQSIDVNHRIKRYKNFNHIKGQTKLFNSFLKYGIENHKFEILEECTKDQLNQKEIYYIQLYNSYYDGLNCNYGGKSMSKKPEEFKQKLKKPKPESFREKIRKAMTGKKQSEELVLKRSLATKKPIIQLDKNNNIVREWNGAVDVEKELGFDRGSLAQALKGRLKSAYGFVWKYKQEL